MTGGGGEVHLVNGLSGRSSQRDMAARLCFLAALGSYAEAVFALRCAADEDWWRESERAEDLEHSQTIPGRGVCGFGVDRRKGSLYRVRNIQRLNDEDDHLEALRITVTDRAGVAAVRPVSGGIPIARSEAPRGSRFVLRRDGRTRVPLQTRVMATWPDGSARWLLLGFQAAPPANGVETFTLSRMGDVAASAHPDPVRCSRGSRPRLRSGSVEVSGSDDALLHIAGRAQVALTLVAASGAICPAIAESTAIEMAGPMHSVLTIAGSFYLPGGKRVFGFQLRTSVYAGLPLIRIEPGIIVDSDHGILQRFRELRMDILPRAPARNARLGGAPGWAGAVKSKRVRLFQVDDQNYLLQGARGKGGKAPGWGELADENGEIAVCLRDFWQQWPKALEVGRTGIGIGLFPRFRKGAFRHMQPWYKHDYLFHNSCYQLRTGQARRWDAWVSLDGDGKSLAAAANQPLVPVLDPAQSISSGAWGPIAAAGTPGMEQYDAIERDMLRGYNASIRDQRDYGAMNWGDWFGERNCNWGNHEYDTVNQLFIRFARTGDLDAFCAADAAARHSSEVDVVHHVNPELDAYFRSTTMPEIYDTYPARPGMMHEHAVGHVGGFHSRERIRRLFMSFGTGKTKNPYLCLDPYNLGHVFAEGMVHHYFLTGDPWLKQTAEKIGANLADLVLAGKYTHFAGGSHSGRVNGWTMLALAAVHELKGDRRIRRAMRRLADLALAEQDPFCGGWLYELPWGHCFCTNRKHVGEAGFITGVRLNGLVRYHRLTGDKRIPAALSRAVTHLNNDTWIERGSGWRYTSCPASGGAGRHGVVLAAVANAFRLAGDPEHLRIVRQAWDASLSDMLDRLRRDPWVGKSYSSRVYGCAEVAALLAGQAGGDNRQQRA